MTRFVRTLTAAAVAAGLTVAGLVVPSAASAQTATSLTASPDAATYTYGARTTVRGHLSATTFYGKNLPVQIAQAGSPTVHGSTRVDSSGNFKFTPQIFTNTAIALYYGGDATYAKASVVFHVSVRANLLTAIDGGYKTSGGYRFVKPDKKFGFAVGLRPNKAGKNVVFRLQINRGGWKTLQTRTQKLDKDSVSAVSIAGTKGYSYRVRGEYAGDSLNVSNVSGYAYIRFG